ncbi:hypothetical protein VNO77_00754 [Canavalia gladiata]|uniref:Uncharacterized protein n=1 Tax=Canavalia gladiata TaxID=3824 RepID=A0AAN9MPZ1_CANGL
MLFTLRPEIHTILELNFFLTYNLELNSPSNPSRNLTIMLFVFLLRFSSVLVSREPAMWFYVFQGVALLYLWLGLELPLFSDCLLPLAIDNTLKLCSCLISRTSVSFQLNPFEPHIVSLSVVEGLKPKPLILKRIYNKEEENQMDLGIRREC